MKECFLFIMGLKYYVHHDHAKVSRALQAKITSLATSYDNIYIYMLDKQRGFEDWAYHAIANTFPEGFVDVCLHQGWAKNAENAKDGQVNRRNAMVELVNRAMLPHVLTALESPEAVLGDNIDVVILTAHEDDHTALQYRKAADNWCEPHDINYTAVFETLLGSHSSLDMEYMTKRGRMNICTEATLKTGRKPTSAGVVALNQQSLED